MIFYYRDISIKLGRLWNLFAVVVATLLALRWEDFVRTPGAVFLQFFDLRLPASALFIGFGLLLCWYFIFSLFGLDRAGRTLFDSRTLVDILIAVVIGTASLGWAQWTLERWLWEGSTSEQVVVSRCLPFMVYFGTILFVLCVAYRLLAYLLLEFGRKGTSNLHHIILIGCNSRAARFAHRIMTTTGYGYHLIGVFDDDVGRSSIFDPPVAYMGPFSDVQEFLRSHPVDEVMLFLPIKSYYDEIATIVGMCRELGIDTSFPYGLFERDGPAVKVGAEGLPSLASLAEHNRGDATVALTAAPVANRGIGPDTAAIPGAAELSMGMPFEEIYDEDRAEDEEDSIVTETGRSRRLLTLTYGFSPPQDWRHFIKYIADFVLALVGVIVLLPLLIGIAVAIRLTSPGPAIFVQQRIGFNRRRIPFYKFRTMVQDAEMRIAELEHLNEMGGAAFKIANDPRVTRLGAFLRKTSLDELPQLFNVLKGEMSLVGPRPLSIRDYDRFYRDAHRRRFSVRPGITCIWQVSGRNKLTFEEWMQLDLEYIDNWTLTGDFVLLFKTIPAVLARDGAT